MVCSASLGASVRNGAGAHAATEPAAAAGPTAAPSRSVMAMRLVMSSPLKHFEIDDTLLTVGEIEGRRDVPEAREEIRVLAFTIFETIDRRGEVACAGRKARDAIAAA